MTDAGLARRARRWRIWQQLPLLVGLVVLWMLLWGEITPLSAISGLVLAVVVTRVFYLPPVELSGRVNVLWLLILMLRFLRAVIFASVSVAALAFRPGPLPKNAIIEVPLRTRSDFVTSIVAILVSLIPGTIVLEIDRARALLFLHVLAARDSDGAEKARRDALRIETTVVRAIGSKADVARTAE